MTSSEASSLTASTPGCRRRWPHRARPHAAARRAGLPGLAAWAATAPSWTASAAVPASRTVFRDRGHGSSPVPEGETRRATAARPIVSAVPGAGQPPRGRSVGEGRAARCSPRLHRQAPRLSAGRARLRGWPGSGRAAASSGRAWKSASMSSAFSSSRWNSSRLSSTVPNWRRWSVTNCVSSRRKPPCARRAAR